MSPERPAHMNQRILSVLCISILSAMLGLGILAPVLPLYARDLGASGTMLGIIFSSFAVTLAIANPLAGRISDRIGFKTIIAAGLGIHVPVALLYVIAANPFHLIAIRLAEGVLCAMIQTVAMAWVGAIAPEKKLGSYMGIFNTFIFLGFGLGPLAGGSLAEFHSIEMPFYFMAGTLALAFILVILLLPSGKKLQAETSAPPVLDVLREGLSSNMMKGLMIFAFVIAIGQSGLLTFLPVIAEDRGISTMGIGILSSVIMFCAGLFQTPFGYLANRFDKPTLIIAGITIVCVILAFIPWCYGFTTFFAGCLIGGTGAALANPAATAMVVSSGRNMGTGFAIGMYNLAFGAGMVAGPVFSGMIMDLFSLEAVFQVNAFIFIAGACVIRHYTKKSVLDIPTTFDRAAQ